MKDPKEENRVKIFAVEPQVVIRKLFPKFDKSGVVQIEHFEGLPDDAIVETAHYDYPTNRFQFRVWSSEFEIVPDGAVPPILVTSRNATLLWKLVDGRSLAEGDRL